MSTRPYKTSGLSPADWQAVAQIYLEGIESGHATFETEVPSWESWDASHLPFGRSVLKADDEVLGWCALSRVSTRQVYSGVTEVSVYVAGKARGRGLGGVLLNTLIEASESHGIWTLQASIFPENHASLKLHKRCGFREVGRRERIAKLHGTWRDTILLERRSKIVGVT